MTALPAILDQLVATLSALRWPAAGGPESVAAFDAVKVWDMADADSIFGYVLTNEGRTAQVVIANERWQSDIRRKKVYGYRVLDLSVVVTESVTGNRVQALHGLAGTNPGAYWLKDAAIDALTGPVFSGDAANDLAVMPLRSNVVNVESSERHLSGRTAIVIDFSIVGGHFETPLNAEWNEKQF